MHGLRLRSLILSLFLLHAACGGCGSSSEPARDDPDDGGSTPPVFGLESRPENSTCLAPDRPIAATGYTTENVFPNAPSFLNITKIIQAPGDPDRWFVLEQRGSIQTFDASDQTNVHTWLDFTSDVTPAAAAGDGRLLGIAFHPDYPSTPEVFIYYVGAPSGSLESVLLRVILDDTGNPVSPVAQVILTLAQTGPFHKGGDVAFGPDGYLYLGLGDGGSSFTAQNTTSLYGAMLRIDVSNTGAGYTIPADNPFVGNAMCTTAVNGADCPEIFAWGLRNPYRWSFDATGRLWVGDVGRNDWEEIDIVGKGGNYGWACREGSQIGPRPGMCAADAPLIDPVFEYSHADGDNSVTGGFVYTGTGMPNLQGQYVFADFVSGRIWALSEDGVGGFTRSELVDTPHLIVAVIPGNDGEIYVGDRGDGRIYKLIATNVGSGDTIALNLADTGCVNPVDPSEPASGLIPYNINAPFWSDGAVKSRYMALPDATTIAINNEDDWEFPEGSVLVKYFRLNGNLIETRLLMRHPDGVWAGYTFEWDVSQTTATRVIGGKIRLIDGQQWIYPSEGQCMVCHTNAAGFSLGLETGQLNRNMTYPPPEGNGSADQLATLDHIMMFSTPLGDPNALPRMPDPFDATADLAERGRAWLHTNCSQCHRPGGPTPSSMDLRFAASLSETNACDVQPQAGDLGIANALLIAPGDSARSVLLARLSRRDADGMPPLGSALVDANGVALVANWIDSLNSCQQ